MGSELWAECRNTFTFPLLSWLHPISLLQVKLMYVCQLASNCLQARLGLSTWSAACVSD
jgi:hypothetical protein